MLPAALLTRARRAAAAVALNASSRVSPDGSGRGSGGGYCNFEAKQKQRLPLANPAVCDNRT